MASTQASTILDQLVEAGKAFKQDEPGSREALIAHSRALVAALEIPSEFIQRTFWAEPAQSATIRLAVDTNLFQHLRDAGAAGLDASTLSQKTGIETSLLQRLTRHLVATNLLTYHENAFHATELSNGLSEERYQHSISFCYDAARPSFNGFPGYFKKNGYQAPTLGGTDGPFQAAHGTELTFFDWLVATPPHLRHFDSFMSAYRAGKKNWYDEGFYPVVERLVNGFEGGENGDVLLVDVGGGRGHDAAAFVKGLEEKVGKVILQDREPVIESVVGSGVEKLGFEAQAHDFFTPQPVIGARAYSLHSILHDWSDGDGVRILENLVPALKKGYSRVLLNEIVVSEEHPTLAATSMDMMMLAHFAVRERTEAEWRGILETAGLRITAIYTYPGVAESLIEAELA
ncbi:hypothetical protein N7522_006581 [Penicillium canescens]|nr:hypothetical protein N7522_006581 [Penicillium canescens]